jgi:16S rRNA (adenine1518-N6/adenine1519-N6)-dimethyltransferase
VVTLLGASDIRTLASELDVTPTKKWGQNFVHDANTVRKIVATAKLAPNEPVVEIGPGLGSLTLGLIEAGHRVTAIEIDRRLASQLPVTLVARGGDPVSLTVIQSDALAVTELPIAPTALVANLPYNISVPVLIHMLETFPTLRRILVMVQAEVGQRLAAGPGTKMYGVPSLKAAWWGDWSLEGTVSRRVFWPEPNVDSVLVGMTAHEVPGDSQLRRTTFALVDAAFGQRRKTLRQALSTLCGSTTAAEELCVTAGIDPSARGEQLRLDGYLALAREQIRLDGKL